MPRSRRHRGLGSRTRQRVALGALALVLMVACPTHAAKVYFADFYSDRIYRVNPDGSNQEVAMQFDDEGELVSIGDFDIDLVARKIYFVVSSAFTSSNFTGLWWANLEGTQIEQLVSDGGNIKGVVVDRSGGKVYWANATSDTIQRADLDGANAEVVISDTDVRRLAIDPQGGKLYWKQHNTVPRGILQANLDGSEIEVFLEGASTGGMTVDPGVGKLYWQDGLINSVFRANLDATGIEELVVDTLKLPSGITLDFDRGKMYWVDSATDLHRANFDGSELEHIVNPPGQVALSARGIFVAVVGSCGDGTLDEFEECDDGNLIDGDGCQQDCLIPVCGDGVLDAGEECDDDGLLSCDGCSPICEIELGTVCGDGIVNAICGEQCDDGNTIDADGCQADCQDPTCGDAIHDPDEECDDGDLFDLDECSAACVLPAGVLYQQVDAPSGVGVFDGVIFAPGDTEAADDFVIPPGVIWEIGELVTVGTPSDLDISEVTITFYEDAQGLPGAPACTYSMTTNFVEQEGDIVTTLVAPCVLGAGHWWVGQSVVSYYHFWSSRTLVNHNESAWRTDDASVPQCNEFAPLSVCGGDPHDLIFQLRGLSGIVGDVDGDADIDLADVVLTFAALGSPATGPSDRRDMDGDGQITLSDVHAQILACTREGCALEPGAPPVTVPPELVEILNALLGFAVPGPGPLSRVLLVVLLVGLGIAELWRRPTPVWAVVPLASPKNRYQRLG